MVNQKKISKGSQGILKSCEWELEKLPGLNSEELSKLQSYGINTTLELIKSGTTQEKKLLLANKLQVNIQYISKWIALADLSRLPSVGVEYCGLLLHGGVISVKQLAEIPTHRLHQQIMRLQVATLQRRDLCPAVELVQKWSREAKVIGNF